MRRVVQFNKDFCVVWHGTRCRRYRRLTEPTYWRLMKLSVAAPDGGTMRPTTPLDSNPIYSFSDRPLRGAISRELSAISSEAHG